MPRPEDNAAAKIVRKEFARRPIDTSRMLIRVAHGTVYLDGQVSMAGLHRGVDIKTEMDHMVKILKQRQGIRDVVLNCIIRN